MQISSWTRLGGRLQASSVREALGGYVGSPIWSGLLLKRSEKIIPLMPLEFDLPTICVMWRCRSWKAAERWFDVPGRSATMCQAWRAWSGGENQELAAGSNDLPPHKEDYWTYIEMYWTSLLLELEFFLFLAWGLGPGGFVRERCTSKISAIPAIPAIPAVQSSTESPRKSPATGQLPQPLTPLPPRLLQPRRPHLPHRTQRGIWRPLRPPQPIRPRGPRRHR